MNCRSLKVGDEVAVRFRRWHDEPRYELGVVAKQCRTSLTLEDGRIFSHVAGRMEVKPLLYEPDADLVELTDEIRAKIEANK